LNSRHSTGTRREPLTGMRRWIVITGLSFAAGALADTALTWRLHEFDNPALDLRIESHDEPRHETPDAVSSVGTAGAPAVTPRLSAGFGRRLTVPVRGIDREDLRDSFSDRRGARSHQALDIMAARGTPVLAADDGRIEKLFTSNAGGLTIYQFDPSGKYCYYYAHLDRYAGDVAEGATVKRGQVIGYVGSTGNAAEDAPHLHFAILELTPERKWWQGTAINPFPALAR
jgi:murein DD-endopeptidase MepM/ murein hydrolase activator NlpD